MEKTELKVVSLKEIKADPNQPRKFFDETAMSELTASIKEKGVLQPILLRPIGSSESHLKKDPAGKMDASIRKAAGYKGPVYLVVCGERRYRGSTSAGLEGIPAIIRDLTDDEALELQIIENLQRKDVHPMEEAVAFKSLLDHGKDPKEIAARVGKSEFYARQRIKLCALTSDWQKAFFANRISVTDALRVALYDEKIQGQLWEDKDNGNEIKIGEWTLRKYSGQLSDAPFSLEDPTLNKKWVPALGASIIQEAQNFFVDSGDKPICTKLDCFQVKFENHFTKEMSAAAAEPDMIFVHDEYGSYSDKNTKGLEQTGFAVLGRRDYDTHELPDKPDLEEFEEEWLDDNDGDASGMGKAFEKECEEYNSEVTDFNKKVAGGKYKKAFVLNGSNKGKYIHITLNKTANTSASAKQTRAKEEGGGLTAEDINGEIERIKSKEKRSKELDEQKIWDDIKKQFNPGANSSLLKSEYSQLEREAIASALHNKLSYPERDVFEKQFNARKGFANVTEETLRQITRFFFLAVLPPVALYSGYNDDAKLCIKIAKDYFPSVLKDVEDAQAVVSNKRIDKINKRIAELQAKKKELSKPVAKPAAKKK